MPPELLYPNGNPHMTTPDRGLSFSILFAEIDYLHREYISDKCTLGKNVGQYYGAGGDIGIFRGRHLLVFFSFFN